MSSRGRGRVEFACRHLWLAISARIALPGEAADRLAAVAEQAASYAVVPLELFVVVERGEPVAESDWLDAQVAHANRLFAPAGLGFEVEEVHEIGGRFAHVATRADRDELGSHSRREGRIQVFVVRRLDDVDVEGNLLYGVHWRLRRDRSQTWVILSTRDEGSTVLAHELGHVFELGHSRYPESIMNKEPRPSPPWAERVFADPEVERIRRQAGRFFASGRLVDLTKDD